MLGRGRGQIGEKAWIGARGHLPQWMKANGRSSGSYSFILRRYDMSTSDGRGAVWGQLIWKARKTDMTEQVISPSTIIEWVRRRIFWGSCGRNTRSRIRDISLLILLCFVWRPLLRFVLPSSASSLSSRPNCTSKADVSLRTVHLGPPLLRSSNLHNHRPRPPPPSPNNRLRWADLRFNPLLRDQHVRSLLQERYL